MDGVVVDHILRLKARGLPGGTLLYNLKPVEQDANAASAVYLRERHPDAVEAILRHPDLGQLARSLVGILTSATAACPASATPDAVETYTADTGGLHYLGDGYWQYNWKTSKNWTGCRTLTVTLSDGDTLTADFQFK